MQLLVYSDYEQDSTVRFYVVSTNRSFKVLYIVRHRERVACFISRSNTGSQCGVQVQRKLCVS